jgi:hypothetical protein
VSPSTSNESVSTVSSQRNKARRAINSCQIDTKGCCRSWRELPIGKMCAEEKNWFAAVTYTDGALERRLIGDDASGGRLAPVEVRQLLQKSILCDNPAEILPHALQNRIDLASGFLRKCSDEIAARDALAAQPRTRYAHESPSNGCDPVWIAASGEQNQCEQDAACEPPYLAAQAHSPMLLGDDLRIGRIQLR